MPRGKGKAHEFVFGRGKEVDDIIILHPIDSDPISSPITHINFIDGSEIIIWSGEWSYYENKSHSKTNKK